MKTILTVILITVSFIKVYAQSHAELVIQHGHLSPIKIVEFNNTSQYLVSSDESNQIIIWDVKSGKEFSSCQAVNLIHEFEFIPDQAKLVFQITKNQLIIWDFSNNNTFDTLNFDFPINDFTSNDNNLFVATQSGTYSYDYQNKSFKQINLNSFSRIEISSDYSSFMAIDERTTEVFELTNQFRLIEKTNRYYINETEKSNSKREIDIKQVKLDPDGHSVVYPFYNSVYKIDLLGNSKAKILNSDYFDINCTTADYSSKSNTIVFGTTDDCVFLHNEKTSKTKSSCSLHLSSITSVALNNNGTLFASASRDQSIIIWDVNKMIPVHRMSLTSMPLHCLTVDKNGEYLYAGNSFGEIKQIPILALNKGMSIKNYRAHGELVSGIFVSDSLLFCSSYDNSVSMINLNTGSILVSSFTNNTLQFQPISTKQIKSSIVEAKSKFVDAIWYNGKEKCIAIAYSNKKSQGINHYTFQNNKWELKYTTNKAIDYIDYLIKESISINDFHICSRNSINSRQMGTRAITKITADNLIFETNQNGINLFQIKDDVKQFTKKIRTAQNISALDYEPEQKKICYAINSALYLTDLNENQVYLGSHSGQITDVVFIPNTPLIAASGMDGSIKIWNYVTQTEACTIIPIHRDQLIYVTPDNYYFSMNNAEREIGYRVNDDYYPAEQFDLKYNRPDLVLDALANSDKKLIDAYNRAYIKRIKKFGLTEEKLQSNFHVPVIELLNSEEIPLITSNSELELHIKATDAQFNLDRINVWINGSAIFGKNGLSLKENKSNSFHEKITLQLAKGLNRIQLSAMNENGIESYRETIDITCEAGKENPDLYLVTIGVSNYIDTRFNLQYAAKDAIDIKFYFEKSKYYENVYTKTLINEEVKLGNLSSIHEFLSKAEINDQVIVFIAGHGVLDNNFDYYFAAHDMNFSNPSEKGIPYELIESLLDAIKPIKKLLLMDTCHSGELDKDDVVKSENENQEEEEITFRNVGIAVESKETKLGLKNSNELMKELFTDFRKGTGATVISSSGGVEFSMESEEWKNGLFTYCFLDGLLTMKADYNRDRCISISEIQEYVQTKVYELSKGKQTPSSRIENQLLNYRIW